MRQLAVDLAINPNTVMRAYRELELGGLLETHQGTGTFIAKKKLEKNSPERERQLGQMAGEFAARAGAAGFTLEDLIERLRDLLPRSHTKEIDVMAKIRMNEVSGIALLLFVISIVIGLAVSQAVHNPAPAIFGALVGLYFLFAIKVDSPVGEGRRAAPGPLRRTARAGPVPHHPGRGDAEPLCGPARARGQRLGRSTLTRDTVPVNVDAIVFWMVWNAEKSILEVENFIEAITLSAQTALRESIGRHELAQMITERETLGRELQRILDEKTNPWGITVQSVEIRDVRIPQGLEDAMSRQAQAERERQARIILGQAEKEIADSFVQAAASYTENPVALHLRAMNMLYEAIKEKGSMVIVPSSAVETMGLAEPSQPRHSAELNRKTFHLNRSKGAQRMNRILEVCLLALTLAANMLSASAQAPALRHSVFALTLPATNSK